MIARRRKSSDRAGFTLLELILAMSLVAIVSLSLYASMRVAFNAKRSAQAAVAPVRGGAIAADLVCKDLESVPPPNGILAGPFIGTYQAGAVAGTELDVLDFYSVGEDATPARQTMPMQEGIRHIELAVRTDVDPPVLVRRVTRNLLSSTGDETEEEILCRGVRSLAIRYFDGTNWYEDWDSTTTDNTLPVAVQLTVEVQADPSLPASQAQSQPYSRVTRTIPIACGRSQDLSDSDSSSGGTQ
jgi:prepilin-type N-terminal cleavage/methylation domain-containing protein